MRSANAPTTLADIRRGLLAVGRDSFSLFVAISVSNLCNYLFHVVISRRIGPASYGELASVLAVLLVLSVPTGAIQTTVAKRVARLPEGSSPEVIAAEWGGILRSLVPIALSLAAIGALVSPLLTSFLRLSSPITALLLAVYLIPSSLVPVLTGAMQGQRKFGQMSVITMVGAFVRILGGIGFVYAGGGVPGALSASIVSGASSMSIALFFLSRRSALQLNVKESLRPLLKDIRPIVAAMAAIWLLIELDLILVRRFLVPAEAGRYAAAGLLARAVLFIPGAIGMVALPRFSATHGRGPDAYRWLISSTLVIAGLGSAAALVLAVFPRLAIVLTFGNEFGEGTGILGPLAFAMIAFGVCSLLVLFHAAAGTRIYPLLFAGILVEGTVIFLNHGSGMAVAVTVLIVSWTIAILGFIEARSVAISPLPLSRLPEDLAVFSSADANRYTRPQLSVVMPTYNAGNALVEMLRSMRILLDGMNRTYEVIVVSDGTTEETDWESLSSAGPVTVMHYPHRQGKGVALRVGMARAKGRYIAFIDSDGDLDPLRMSGFLTVMDTFDPDLVLGSKRHPLSKVQYPLTRRVMSRMYQILCRLLFGLTVRDTQTGMKLIRRDVLNAVLPRLVEKRFAFDLEFLVVAKRLGYKRIFEVPVRLNYKFSSTVAAQAVVRILLDTIAIFYRRYILLSYDLTPDTIDPRAATSVEDVLVTSESATAFD